MGDVTRKTETLELLQQAPRCGQELVEAGIGYRYSARIYDLRSDGHVIEDHPCRRHEHRAAMVEYRLAGWDDGQMEMTL